MINKIGGLFLDPYPLRTILITLIKKGKIFGYKKRLKIGALERQHYGYCVYHAAMLAKKLGNPKISVLEFGVAGGNGLVNLEYHAQKVTKCSHIDIDVYGFDTGEGLPDFLDYRDLPYYFQKGFYDMDVQKLKKRLKTAKLILGDIKNTIDVFLKEYNPAPIGAIMFDLDYYSSTKAALDMFEADEKYFLPRVFCYFDDVSGNETALYNDFTGERLAISEFNQTHKTRKLAKAHLSPQKIVVPWHHKLWIFHNFEHNKYNFFVAKSRLPIRLGNRQLQ